MHDGANDKIMNGDQLCHSKSSRFNMSTDSVNLKITWGHCPPSHEDNLMKATTSPFFNLTTNLAIKIVVQFFF